MTSRSSRRYAPVALILLLLLSVGSAFAQSVPPGEKPDPQITDGRAQLALDVARTKWKNAKIRNYQVRVALSCFCPENIRKPRTIKVRGSVPIKPPEHLKSVANVGRMFARIQGAIDKGVASIRVTYGKYGVPRAITIDISQSIADEESYYTIDRFKKSH